jgi:hypothetical protein
LQVEITARSQDHDPILESEAAAARAVLTAWTARTAEAKKALKA